jgi:hypothetical protein
VSLLRAALTWRSGVVCSINPDERSGVKYNRVAVVLAPPAGAISGLACSLNI